MKRWINDRLFTCKSPFKTQYIKEADPSLIVDLRENPNKFYEKSFDGDVKCLEIPSNGGIHQDVGRAVKDKNMSTKKLCQSIVNDYLKKGKTVLIVSNGGEFIAVICKWWYNGDTSVDYINDLRNSNDYTTAKSKEQIGQMKEIEAHSTKNNFWEKNGFKSTIK